MLNQEMVKAGFAWWFSKYSNNRDLGMMQLETRLQHIGLWKAKNPVAPWVFRKVKDLLH
jgi:endonuclease YncB( thermonuclease family)